MIALYVIVGIIGAALLLYVLPMLFLAHLLFSILLVRTKPSKWSRNCSWDDEEQKRMFAIGEEWGATHEQYHRQVSIVSDKYKLVGEYFDFGYDKAVIIVPGRMETCVYSYYFAKPYEETGYNVLAIDNRSHGLSQGRYNTVGMKEYEDIINWASFLHDSCGIKKIMFHGICIGSATVLNAFTFVQPPEYYQGLVADGMYLHFGSMLEKRIKERHHNPHPMTEIVMSMIKCVSGKNPAKNGPIHNIDKMKKPMLFLYSKKDVYSDPVEVQSLYDKCGGDKQIVWFDEGIHSHIRINDTEKYDNTIKSFISDYITTV